MNPIKILTFISFVIVLSFNVSADSRLDEIVVTAQKKA